jgi:hypothetical protein
MPTQNILPNFNAASPYCANILVRARSASRKARLRAYRSRSLPRDTGRTGRLTYRLSIVRCARLRSPSQQLMIQKTKEAISLADIQKQYFEYIERNFGSIYKTMKERKLTPHDAGIALSRENQSRKDLLANLEAFLSDITHFWEAAFSPTSIHIEDFTTSKAIYGGDLFPTHSRNIASTAGLYIDTIVRPDPFVRSKIVMKQSDDERRVYYLIKHATNLLQYKDLPIAVRYTNCGHFAGAKFT